jgi:uncharacterized phage protein (TIGR01671 family)
MREIKFRAWNPNWDEMVYSTLETVFDKREFYSFGFEVGFSHYPEEGWIIAQYTGLKDKNGREIYEGDIVVTPDHYIWFDDGQPNYRGTVEWIFSQWQVVAHCINPRKRGISDGMNEALNDIGWDEGEITSWEVIGNIHDNPELLEVR